MNRPRCVSGWGGRRDEGGPSSLSKASSVTSQPVGFDVPPRDGDLCVSGMGPGTEPASVSTRSYPSRVVPECRAMMPGLSDLSTGATGMPLVGKSLTSIPALPRRCLGRTSEGGYRPRARFHRLVSQVLQPGRSNRIPGEPSLAAPGGGEPHLADVVSSL